MSELIALITVIFIDISLSADNAVVIGMAAAGLAANQRKKAIFFGIASAALLRVVFAVFAVKLLNVLGLLIAGGVLLLWVSWKLYEELRGGSEQETKISAKKKTFFAAVSQILIADVSMSLDNVLAVAGAAREHITVMIFGLALSVALMGFAASFISTLINRYKWISWLGLLIIVFVALRMIYEGAHDIYAIL